MALSQIASNLTATAVGPLGRGQVTYPVSLTSDWGVLLPPGVVAIQDAATVTNPESDVTASTSRIVTLPEVIGTTLLLSMGYDKNLTVSTSPVVVVFGRRSFNGSVGRWMLLPTITGLRTITLTAASTTDTNDGALKWTQVVTAATAVDLLGCNEVVVCVQTALAGTGVTGTARVEGKVI